MAKVFLGVGHGGKDPGAVGNGFHESDLNLAIALACRDVLERHGVTVGMSRTTDEYDPVSDEAKECNAFMPDLGLDIHNNASGTGKGDGAEVYYHYNGGTGKKLAENVLAEIVAIGQNSRGIKTRRRSDGRDYYHFIRETACPSVVVECAFIDNADDIAILDTAEKRKAMGVAIAKGVLSTLGIAFVEEKKTHYIVQIDREFGGRASAEQMKMKLQKAGFDAIVIKTEA